MIFGIYQRNYGVCGGFASLEQVGSIYKDALSGGYRTECGRILDMKLIASAENIQE